jgi:hypothetical protein
MAEQNPQCLVYIYSFIVSKDEVSRREASLYYSAPYVRSEMKCKHVILIALNIVNDPQNKCQSQPGKSI